MKARRNAVRLQRPAGVSSPWEETKKWAGRNDTNERVARNGLAFAGAVSLCYVAERAVQGLQSLVAYAY
jgi:hypothetical protein